MVAITPTAMKALYAIRPASVGGGQKVFGLSESQITRRVKAAGPSDWELFSGHSGRVGMARRMAQNGAPTHEIERQGRWKQGCGMVRPLHPRRGRQIGAAVLVARDCAEQDVGGTDGSGVQPVAAGRVGLDDGVNWR